MTLCFPIFHPCKESLTPAEARRREAQFYRDMTGDLPPVLRRPLEALGLLSRRSPPPEAEG